VLLVRPQIQLRVSWFAAFLRNKADLAMIQDSGFSEMSSFRTFILLGMLAIAALDLLPLLERRDSGGFQEVHAHHVGV
jgi:hypothetical protein